MNRYRYYKFSSSCDLDSLIDKLKEKFKFKSQFRFEKESSEQVNFFFESALGNVHGHFIKIEQQILILFENPNAGVKAFSNALFDVCGSPCVFEALNISFDDAEMLIKHYEFEATLSAVTITKLFLAPDIESEMIFKSEKGVNLSKIEFLSGKKYHIARKTWCIQDRGKLSISSDGKIGLEEDLLFILNYLEKNILAYR